MNVEKSLFLAAALYIAALVYLSALGGDGYFERSPHKQKKSDTLEQSMMVTNPLWNNAVEFAQAYSSRARLIVWGVGGSVYVIEPSPDYTTDGLDFRKYRYRVLYVNGRVLTGARGH